MTPGPPQPPPIASFRHAAKWYGHVIGLVDATVDIGPGVTGLLGPNGAGKSTFLKLLTGQLQPSQGSVQLLGVDPFAKPSVHAQVGFLPEQDAFYEDMTGRGFVRFLAGLHGVPRANMTQQLVAVHFGQTDIADENVRSVRSDRRQRLLRGHRHQHPGPVALQDPAHELGAVGVIFDDEDADAVQRHFL